MEAPIILIVIFVVIVVIILFNSFTQKAIVKRKLKNTPSKEIKDFRNGDVAKIVGKVEFAKKPLIAPLSERECTYYNILVEKKVSNGKSSSWKKIIKEEISQDFIIREKDKIAIIETQNIKSYLVPDKKFSSGAFNDATPNLESYLHKHGHESTGLLGFNKSIRYKEGVLEKGETVAVVGVGKWTETSELVKNTSVLKITAQNEIPVFLSDSPDTLEFVSPKKQNITTSRSFQRPERTEKPEKQKRSGRYSKSYK
jgi:hypothetical protein